MRPLLWRLAIWSLILGGFSPVGAAQYSFDSWTTDNGLPQNSINAILQTRDGYLWIATNDGLVRYDGARFTTFNRGNAPGINDNRCFHLLEDHQGTLWILNQLGLMAYRDGAFHSYTADDGLPENHIFQFFEDVDGSFMILSKRGLFRWQDGRSSPIASEGGAPEEVFGYQDRGGGIWYNGANALVHRTSDGKSTLYQPPRITKDGWVTCAYEDSRGNFWIGTRIGLYRMTGQTFIPYEGRGDFASSPIACITEDRQASLWVGTEAGGLFQIPSGPVAGGAFDAAPEARALAYNPAGGPDVNRVHVMLRDREGTMWLGTSYYGLLRVNKQVVTMYTTRNGLATDNIYPIYEARDGAVWIGGWPSRVNRYKDGRVTYYGENEKWFTSSIAEDSEGGLWVGKNVGLVRFKGAGFTNEEDIIGLKTIYEVDVIHQDREGAMWFGTSDGLVKYKDGARTFYTTRDGLAGNQVKAILEDRQSTLWIGTYGGLSRLKDGTFTSYKRSDGVASEHIRSLYEDDDGTLWIGTYDGGLSRLKEGRFTNYSTENGLFNNGVFQILDDLRGNLWMSSNLGIYRTSKQELNDLAEGKTRAITCIAYGKRDGMLNVECNGGMQPAGVRTRDGRLWFPTQIGAAVINPADVPFNALPPPVLIEGSVIDGAPVQARNAMRILPGQENFEIDYTGLSFVNPEHVHFRYKMEGLDHDWVEAGTRRAAFYSHVPPGRYKFSVIAANADGVWNLEGASLDITVVPPFWKTWWFSLLLVASLAGLAAIIYRRRVSMLQRASLAQEAFSRQLIESQEMERKRIAAELHDSLGQSLSIIVNRATLVLSKPQDPDRAIEQVGEIAATASDAIKEVREIAYTLRPVELDRLGLTKSLRAMIKKVSASTGIDIRGDIDEVDGLFSAESEINLYRIVQESISNIVKHSAATEAAVEIRRMGAAISVTIKDNGRGFALRGSSAADSVSAGFGLMGISERARILGGKYTIQSSPGQGATINIHVDLKANSNGG